MKRELVHLDEIADITNGVFVRSSSLVNDQSGVPVLSVKSLADTTIDLSATEFAFINSEDVQRCQVLANDVLISSRSTSMTTGIVPEQCSGAVINSTLIGIRLRGGTLHPRLLVAWLHTGLGQSHFESRSQSTTLQMNVTVKELSTLPVPIFSKSEQQILVEALSEADQAHDAAIEAAKIRRSISHQLVTDILLGKVRVN